MCLGRIGQRMRGGQCFLDFGVIVMRRHRKMVFSLDGNRNFDRYAAIFIDRCIRAEL